MSLNDKLKVAVAESASKLCKLAALLNSNDITEAEKKNLIAILNVGENDPARVPTTVIGKILREEGHNISNSAIDRHRKQDKSCSCAHAAERTK